MKKIFKNLDAKIDNGNKIYIDYDNLKMKIKNEARLK